MGNRTRYFCDQTLDQTENISVHFHAFFLYIRGENGEQKWDSIAGQVFINHLPSNILSLSSLFVIMISFSNSHSVKRSTLATGPTQRYE